MATTATGKTEKKTRPQQPQPVMPMDIFGNTTHDGIKSILNRTAEMRVPKEYCHESFIHVEVNQAMKKLRKPGGYYYINHEFEADKIIKATHAPKRGGQYIVEAFRVTKHAMQKEEVVSFLLERNSKLFGAYGLFLAKRHCPEVLHPGAYTYGIDHASKYHLSKEYSLVHDALVPKHRVPGILTPRYQGGWYELGMGQHEMDWNTGWCFLSFREE